MRKLLVLNLLLLSLSHAAPGAVMTLDDVEFWVGTGQHQAGIAIDWDGDNLAPDQWPALAWGYRWDGTLTVEQAMRDVLTADVRLFAKLSAAGEFGTAVYGLGYDSDNDSQFALDDETHFDGDGVAISGPSDGVIAEGQDTYREGWQTDGFWQLATTSTSVTENWVTSGGGISSTALVPSTWAGLAFTPFYNPGAHPDQLKAAPSQLLPGDYNRDGAVTLADYTVWRNALGSAVSMPGELADGNGDRMIDVADYTVWKQNFGHGATGSLVESTRSGSLAAVPEPAGAVLMLFVCFVLMLGGRGYQLRSVGRRLRL